MAYNENPNMRSVVSQTAQSPTDPVAQWRSIQAMANYISSAGIWDVGTGAVPDSYGLNGQFVVNTSTQEVFHKENGTWVSIGFLSPGSGFGTLQQTLATGNTTTLTAEFINGADEVIIDNTEIEATDGTSTSTFSPTGLVVDTSGPGISVSDVAGSIDGFSINTATGIFWLGDKSGTLSTPFVDASVGTYITMAAAGGNQYFNADNTTSTTTVNSSGVGGKIRLATIVPGVNIELDNGAKSIALTTDGGDCTWETDTLQFTNTTNARLVNILPASAQIDVTDGAARFVTINAVTSTISVENGAVTTLIGAGSIDMDGGIRITSTIIDDQSSGTGIDFTGTTGDIEFPSTISVGATFYREASLVAAGAYDASTAGNGNFTVSPNGTGRARVVDANGTLVLTSNSGWTASTTTTTLKTGLSDASTLANVLSYLKALEDHLFGTMGLIHA